MSGCLIDCLRPLGGHKGLHPSDLVCSLLLPLCLCAPGHGLVISLLSVGLSCCSWMSFWLDCRPVQHSSCIKLLAAGLLPLAAAATSLFPLPVVSVLLCWSYRPAVSHLVRSCPGSFTAGEAALAVQGLLLIVASWLLRTWPLSSELLHRLLQKSSSKTTILLIVSWAVLSLASVGVVALYKTHGWQVNTRTRKIFHLAIVLVYTSGLVWDPELLYLASIAATAVFLSVEVVRVSRLMPVLSDLLNSYLKHFTDEKEGGCLILTNIYLLVGVSLPIWLWPHPIKPAPPLPLYAGILSVGVGDTCASLVGSWWGCHRWRDAYPRTVEGSLAFIVSILATVLFLYSSNVLSVRSWILLSCVTALTALFEAVSEQVDNLTLPLVMYAGLMWTS